MGIRSGNAQTIWPHVFRNVPSVPLQREVWSVAQDRVIDVTLVPDKPNAPGVVILHGMEARAESGYMRGFLGACHALGWNAAAWEFPSCGPSAARQRGLYNAGRTDDMESLREQTSTRWGHPPLAVIGISLGGNVLLKWLGEQGAASRLRAAVAISVPFDLSACAKRLDAPGFFSWIYRERFLRTLRRKALREGERGAVPYTAEAVKGIRTFAEFDAVVTAPLFGFANAEDYWHRSSSVGFLPRIRRPTLLLSAKDDPFVGSAVVPYDAVRDNPFLTLWLSERGGHVGFVGGSVFHPRFIAESVALTFLQTQFAGDALPTPI